MAAVLLRRRPRGLARRNRLAVRLPRPSLTLRLRLLGWALLLVAIASLASVAVVRQVLLNELDRRVTADLAREVGEFRLLADGHDPATGEPFGDDLAAMVDAYLSRNEPREGEAVLLFVDGALHGATPDPPAPLTDPDLVAHWTSLTTSQYGGVERTSAGPVRWLAVPLTAGGTAVGHMVVAQFTAGQLAVVDRAVRLMVLASLLVVAVVAAGGYLAMGRALRPLRTVTETARAIEQTDLSRRIEVTGSDEVARLSRTFNAMVARLERAFAEQRQFLTLVGHELRTPLTIIRGHLEVMGDDPADRQETVALVTDELDRMNRMVNDLLLLARAEQPDFLRLAEVDVAAMVGDVHAKAAALGARDWRLGPVEPLTLRADRQRLEQALMQLVQNAVQYTDEGDAITLSARSVDGEACLAVRDTGIGIDPEDLPRLTERFWRAAGSRRRADGAGLGLAIVHAIVHAHQGRLTIDSRPGAGSTFTLVIPLDAGAARESDRDEPGADRRG